MVSQPPAAISPVQDSQVEGLASGIPTSMKTMQGGEDTDGATDVSLRKEGHSPLCDLSVFLMLSMVPAFDTGQARLHS